MVRLALQLIAQHRSELAVLSGELGAEPALVSVDDKRGMHRRESSQRGGGAEQDGAPPRGEFAAGPERIEHDQSGPDHDDEESGLDADKTTNGQPRAGGGHPGDLPARTAGIEDVAAEQHDGGEHADQAHVIAEDGAGHEHHEDTGDQGEPGLSGDPPHEGVTEQRGRGGQHGEINPHGQPVRTKQGEEPDQRIKPKQIVADEHVGQRPLTAEDAHGDERIAPLLTAQGQTGSVVGSVINRGESRQQQEAATAQKQLHPGHFAQAKAPPCARSFNHRTARVGKAPARWNHFPRGGERRRRLERGLSRAGGFIWSAESSPQVRPRLRPSAGFP